MDFYTGKPPNLVGPIMKSTVNKVTKLVPSNNTISDKITAYVNEFYNNYIAEYKMIVLIVLISVIYLIYRYYSVKEKKPLFADKITEKFTEDEEKNLMKDIMEYQTRHLKYDNPPSMNPTQPLEDQEDDVFYPPDPLPVRIPDKGIVYTRNIYENPPPYPKMNHTTYDHDNVYKNSSRSYYDGTYNTYQNAKDTNIINPYNWSNNFNSNTGNFVTGMTDTNSQVMKEYQTFIDNKNGNLINALNNGTDFIKSNNPGYDLEPPFATD